MNNPATAERFLTPRPAAARLKLPEAFVRREVRAGRVPGFTSGASNRPRFYIDVEQYKTMLERRISNAVTDEAGAVTSPAATVCAAQ